VWSGKKTTATNDDRMHADGVIVRRSAADSSPDFLARRSGTMASREAVLVTGATGFTGGRLALHLRQLGHPVRALVRPGAATDALRAAGVALIEGDIRSPPDVMRAAEDVSAIYHLAAAFRIAGQPDSFYRDVNVRGTANVVAAAQTHRVARMIHCSTIGVHGSVKEIPSTETSPFNPRDIYQETKLEGELVARAAIDRGLPGVIVRPAAIYGPGDLRFLKLFRAIKTHRFRMFGSGEAFWHPVYIDDLVDGFLLCGERPEALGKTYILAGERYVTLNEWVAGIAHSIGVRPPRGHLPYWPLAVAAAACEELCRPFGIDPPLYRRRAAFFCSNRAFRIDRARHELGYRPRVAIEAGLQRLASWHLECGHLAPVG
jgi:nucleoside-diphosphate-sugar epimerase